MLLSLILAFASLGQTQAAKTADKVGGQLGLRSVTLEKNQRELQERAKSLDKLNRELTEQLLESQKLLNKYKKDK